jgi:transglutaminase-like putative cysteine protease
LAGAIGAALILPVMVGLVLVPGGASPDVLFRATAVAVERAVVDLVVLRLPRTNQSGHFLLAIGAIVWSVGQFAAYAVFAHRRPLDAVCVAGTLLLGNMALAGDQLLLLVVFSIAALCVLARTHAHEEEATWRRRRISDEGAVRGLYLRGGAAFTAAAVFGSLVLTVSASGDPLRHAWSGVDETIFDWSQSVQRHLPFRATDRSVGFGFGSTLTVTDVWNDGDQRLAATIRRTPGDASGQYWRTAAYDHFDGWRWAWADFRESTRPSGEPLLPELADAAGDLLTRRTMQYSVEISAALAGDLILSPADPVAVDRPARVTALGALGLFGGVEVDSDRYTVTASVPLEGDESNGLTASRLRAAGTAYPAEIEHLYLQLPSKLGPAARTLLDEIERDAEDTPYDLAKAIEGRLRSSEFAYDSDVKGLCDSDRTVTDCFAKHKRGFCVHYASTMAALLREARVPARVAVGFLPGELNQGTGVETITGGNAHAWVEVWFPGFGWHRFDPTGGNGAEPEELRPGAPVSPTPSSSSSVGGVSASDRGGDPLPDRNDGSSTARPPEATAEHGPANPALLAVVAILLLVGAGLLSFVAWQRGPRGEVTVDTVWRGIGRTATRFGFGPRPQQTVYEYARTLADVLPESRPDLHAVAQAKVEVAYGHQGLRHPAAQPLREAQRRLRLGLLRLALRRRSARRR